MQVILSTSNMGAALSRVMGLLRRKISDKMLLRLIRRYLSSGMLLGGVVSQREEGTPQGGPLSPLLSNILLDELDKELESRGHYFIRYADDVSIFKRSKRAAHRVRASITRFLNQKLLLTVNEEKTSICRPVKFKCKHPVNYPFSSKRTQQGSNSLILLTGWSGNLSRIA